MRLRADRVAATARPLYLLSICLLAVPAVAQLDPVKNFCRRFGHQTAVLDGKLYIDGGLVNYNPISQYPANYTHTNLAYHDLKVMGSGKMPQLYSNLTKNSSVPSVHGGTLWTDEVNKRLYLFGGETHQQPPPPYFNLWSYDVLENQWDSFGPSQQGPIQGVSYGAGVSVSQRGEGYYFGGLMSNASVPGWSGPPVATSSLIKYNMDKNEWMNISGPTDGIRRAEGSMVFLPVGDAGMLAYFGGIQDLSQNGTFEGQPLDQILLYDVLSSKWYNQPATGNVPEMRGRFCAGATWAADQSSYNIYLYGGTGMPPATSGFDDLYVLTIPTFQWIKLYPDGNETGQYPHHSLSCNVIDNAQMMIIGGTFPLSTDCDVPDQFGTHNLDMGMQNPDKAAWQLFRPTGLTSYAVPDPIISVVGGSGRGDATKRAPEKGFSNPDLKVLMARKAEFAVRTPTREVSPSQPTNTTLPDTSDDKPKSRSLSGGAIGGIVVGVVALLALLAAAFWFIRRRRNNEAPANETQPAPETKEIPPQTTYDDRQTWPPQSPPQTYAPASPPPTSPFSTASTQYYAAPAAAPVELDGAHGSNVWHSPDGTTYALVSPNSPDGRRFSGGNVPTKIDSEGRVWAEVPMSGGSSYASPSPFKPESAMGAPQELHNEDKRGNPGWS
ncbi:hypothetical protein QBC39DRAFT_267664 [Podospora conica]|nr:hypothetical protein QBC39DRAFT_267664 [Schizothecium conicum]